MSIQPISLGNTFTNSGGTTVLGGLSSGLNTQSVINSIAAAQSSQITALQDKVTVNNSQTSALNKLQTLLSALQSAAAPLSNPQSGDNSTNLFAVTTSTITSNTTQAASNFVTATAASGTATGSYVISNIASIATKTTQETGAFSITDPSQSVVSTAGGSGQFTAGTTIVNGASITLTDGESLTAVAQAFNDKSSTSGIAANVLQTSAGSYKLIFASTTTGIGSGFDLSDQTTNTAGNDTVTSGSNVFSGITFHTDQSGTDAVFKLNGVSVDRSTNVITDLIPGVTLNLLQDTTTQPGASFTLQIAPDTASIAQGVNNFASAYNNFLYFYSQQTQLNTGGTPASASVLYSDTTLSSLFNQLSQQASTIVQGIAGSNPNKLSDIGLSFTDAAATATEPATANLLSVDNVALTSALQSNFSGVENVLGYNLASSSPNLILFQSSNLQTVANFTVNVDQTNGVYTASYTDASGLNQTVNLTSSPLGTGGVSLTGPSGSDIAGLQLLYVGTGDESNISVKTTQGIADQLNNIATTAVTPNTGSIANDLTAIQAKNTSLQTQITSVTSQVATTRQQLLAKFSALESAISQANSSLNFLNAQQSAASSGG